MLRDDPNQGYWGLFHTDYTPKLSGTYLHNLTAILADTGAIAIPGHLVYSIPAQPTTVHDLLLQKKNGTFELAVWNEKATGSNSISVNLGIVFAEVRVYDPVQGITPTQTLANVNSVQLILSDHPVIVEIPNLAVAGQLCRGGNLFNNSGFIINSSSRIENGVLIRYYIALGQEVTFQLFDIQGRLVEMLAAGFQEAGYHSAISSGRVMMDGIYYCRMQMKGLSAVQKVQIIR
jgi:hypothetical protein